MTDDNRRYVVYLPSDRFPDAKVGDEVTYGDCLRGVVSAVVRVGGQLKLTLDDVVMVVPKRYAHR